jgi:hypothetical protein
MKRTLVVLALAVLSTAGCRAVGPGGFGCGDPCCSDPYCSDSGCADGACASGGCCDACGGECGGACGRGGCLEQGCSGGACGLCGGFCLGRCGLFQRYCGHNCGPGYGPGQYDCSPCNSPNWGCNGYRHPHGFVSGNECFCGNCPSDCPPACAKVCGNGYCCACCGQPAPQCCCASGDHNYNFNPGPPVAQTAYPYYTVRGPRDFLLDNPPPLGPY